MDTVQTLILQEYASGLSHIIAERVAPAFIVSVSPLFVVFFQLYNVVSLDFSYSLHFSHSKFISFLLLLLLFPDVAPDLMNNRNLLMQRNLLFFAVVYIRQ